MKALLNLVRRGNMREIRARAVQIGKMETYRPFANRLEQLARGYEEKEIRTLIERFMGAD